MKVGLLCTLQAPDWWRQPWPRIYAELQEQAEAAEALGYDALWLGEHHFLDDGHCPAPLVVAAALAARTRRVRVGTCVALLPLYHPIRLAEDAAVVDVISDGRLTLGVGQGYQQAEFAGFGIALAERFGRARETLAIARRLWTEERVTFRGRYWRLDDVTLNPRPVQQPHPPIWFAAVRPRAVARIARTGGVLIRPPADPLPRLCATERLYREALSQRQPAARPLVREVYVAEDDQQARRDVEVHVLYIYREQYTRWGALGEWTADGHYRRVYDPHDPALEWERLRRDRFVIGDPLTCARELRRYRDALQTDYLIARMHFPGLTHDKIVRSMELFAREVLPRCQTAPPP